MTMKWKLLVKLGVSLLVVGLIVGACGGSDPTAVPPAPAATPVPPAPTAAPAKPSATKAPVATATRKPVPTVTPTPVPPTATPGEMPDRGGTLRFYAPSEPATLDATKIEHYTLFFSMDEIWSNLIQFKSDFYAQAEFLPDLAESWTVSSKGDVYTFKLAEGAKFHNKAPLNGRALTSADVKWSLELYQDKDYGSRQRGRLEKIKDIAAPSPDTVVITLTEPLNNFFFNIAWVTVKIHAKELLEQKLIGKREGLLGSGPFVFDEWKTGSSVKCVRSTNYWRNGADNKALPYLDAIEEIIISDGATHIAAIRTGQIDFAGITGLSPLITGPLKGGIKGLEIEGVHPLFTQQVDFNNTSGPTTNLKVRQALMKATDTASILRNAVKTKLPLESYVHSPLKGSLPLKELEVLQKPDPEGAKRLLAEAGYTKDNPLKIELLIVLSRAPGSETGALLQQQWQDVGVEVKLKAPAQKAAMALQAEGKYQVLTSTYSLYLDGIDLLNQHHTTGGARNFDNYSNKEFDALVDKAVTTFDEKQVIEIMQQAQRLLWKELPGIPISNGEKDQIHWEWVKGFRNQVAWGNQGFKFAWIDQSVKDALK